MKRIIASIGVIVILATLIGTSVFAGTLNVVDITPKDGEGGKHPQNMAVKVTFDQDMMNEEAIDANKPYVRITDSEGVSQPFEIMHSAEKYPNQLWIVLEQTLESNTEYTVEIMPGIRSAKGDVLEKEMTTTFKTRNTDTDAKVSLGLMAVMMVFMFTATSQAAKKAAEKDHFEASGQVREENLNPYKIAKIRGISFEEATAYVEKEKKKIARREAKLEEERKRYEARKAAEMEAIEEELRRAERKAGKFRVFGPKSVREAGGRIPPSVIEKHEARKKAAKAAKKKQPVRQAKSRKKNR